MVEIYGLPKFAIFDLDDTIYDYQNSHYHGTQNLLFYLSQNLQIPIPEVRNSLNRARLRVKQRLGNVGSSHSRLLYISEYFRGELQINAPRQLLEAEETYWENFIENMTLFTGVSELLEALSNEKCKLILATDLTLQIQLRKVIKLGLEDTFEFVIASEETPGDKLTGGIESLIKGIKGMDLTSGLCVGDNRNDYMLKDKTLFAHKVNNLKIAQCSACDLDFMDYSKLNHFFGF